jgi:hypothetical protein
VSERKFLITALVFSFYESRAFTTIMKPPGNLQLSADGQTVKGTEAVVLLDREGV